MQMIALEEKQWGNVSPSKKWKVAVPNDSNAFPLYYTRTLLARNVNLVDYTTGTKECDFLAAFSCREGVVEYAGQENGGLNTSGAEFHRNIHFGYCSSIFVFLQM